MTTKLESMEIIGMASHYIQFPHLNSFRGDRYNFYKMAFTQMNLQISTKP